MVERAEGNYSAYAPDLPGVVAAGDTVEETERLMREGKLPLSNIASYLGYAEQSAFNHAFERWHGQSPSKWTKQAARSHEEARVAG